MGRLLEVRDLAISFGFPPNEIAAVESVSFFLEQGEILGIVGESGSGKTMTALSICRLLPPTARLVSGAIIFEGHDLLSLSESKMRKLRGAKIAMIFQDPTSSLNPVVCIGEQIREMVRLHGTNVRRKDQKRAVLDILKRIGFADPERHYRNFPHELSGGMNQRVVAAIMALVAMPSLLIADEPTTALDVTLQAKLLDMITSFVRERKISMLFITHNLGLVAEYADRVLVMQKGRIVETGPVFEVFSSPSHPYTKHLLEVVPRLKKRGA